MKLVLMAYGPEGMISAMIFQGVKFLFFPIFWPASYFLLFFRFLLCTQKHFEILEIKLPIKLINSTKN